MTWYPGQNLNLASQKHQCSAAFKLLMLHQVYQNVPGNANSHSNWLQHGNTAARRVARSLCAHVREVDAHCNLSVLC